MSRFNPIGLKREGVLEESREGTYRITGFADSIKRKTVNWRGKGEARIGGSCHVVNDLLARRHLCVPHGSGIRGIARVHLPESYSLLPSITGQPCIAHICARAFRISSFSFPRAVRQLCFFPLPSERKKEISFLREISSSKIHLFVKSIGKGGRVISSLPFQ